MSNYNQLKDVLNDIFELNKADLDFGIYRIINQKRKQVNAFIDKQLPADIKKALSETQTSDKAELENDLKTLKKNLDDAGVVAEDSPKYKLLRDKLTLLDNSDELEQEVFSHLANFFRRYYKDGDFISMRRYKKDVYAIPYEGEEVKLHWANHDQYYIKSSENFKNYSFLLGDNRKVTFQLKEVSTEQNNNKTQGDAERRFAIFGETPVEVIAGELFLNFVYEPFPKATKQDSLLAAAIGTLTAHVPAEFSGLFALRGTEKNPRRTLLEKHLNDYVSKNSFDYFIHKDLDGFLNRELDFYIKNEVLYLDDINARQTDFFVAQLSKVKAIKAVASKVIEFLAQIENFQKKLWLKKKLVLRTDYCITLDRIPAAYYPEIFANKVQLDEWKTLFDVDIEKIRNSGELFKTTDAELAEAEKFLVLDTKFFDETFKDRLLAEFDDLDEQINGLLINSENFQALGLMQEKYQENIDVTYIDPPYNTGSDGFAYRDAYQHSSWLSMISNRLTIARSLLSYNNGISLISISEEEVANLKLICDDTFHGNFINTIISRRQDKNLNLQFIDNGLPSLSVGFEYILAYRKSDNAKINPVYSETSEERAQEGYWKGFWNDADRPTMRYEILGFTPLSGQWKWKKLTAMEAVENYLEFENKYSQNETLEQYWERSGKSKKFIKRNTNGSGKNLGVEHWIPPTTQKLRSTLWGDILALKAIANDFGLNFSSPKNPKLIQECINYGSDFSATILDYFSGSGTTGHATIKLNREDGGNRKYILVEMGTYFNTVTKPRIQKVIYSDNWKNGKPQDKAGISQLFKYQVLESYEDTLNNLYLKVPENQVQLDFNKRAQEEYLLQYMLEMESREHLFNLEMFRKPFDFQLKVTENNELKPTKVDLVETFNYLIGLYVSKMQRVKDIKVVEGVTRTGIKTLVIWRDMETTTHDDVVKLVRRFYDSARTREFQQIYINGDHHLENLRTDGDQFKIKGIEETFFKKMFNENEL